MKHWFLITALCLILLGQPCVALAEPLPSALEHQPVAITTSEGLTLSAYVSRPKGSTTDLPALFLTQWVSCGSIAPDTERLSLHERLALSAGFALIRVDRAGTGMSQGPGCDQLDYDTEVRHYREALDQIAAHPWVDSQNMFVIGSSLGSTTAPLVAQGKSVAGVIAQGAGALTYFERMLHFDRIQLERETDFEPREIDIEMRRRMEFQWLYLHEKLTPSEIAERNPELSDVWASLRGTDAAPHYGRPYAWHWQAADQNWLSAWVSIEAPVMVAFGEYEQFESRHGHRVIVDTINRLRPGNATWLEVSRAGHGLRIYPDTYAAYNFEQGQRRPELFVEPVARWLKNIVGSNVER